MVFRKIGVSIGDIKKLMNGEIELRDSLNNSEENLIAQIDELNSALELLKDMKKSETDFASVDENYYFDKITHSEKSGGRFIDLSKDYLEFEKSILINMLHFTGMKAIDKKFGTVGVLIGVIAICTVCGFAAHFIFSSTTFWNGFFYPLHLFLRASIVATPIYIISKKNPKAARIIANVLAVVIISVIILKLGNIIFSYIKLFLHILKLFKFKT